MPASREFMVICQAQLSLLEESLGVSSAIVYLTESWDEAAAPRLKQIAAVPIEGNARSLQLPESHTENSSTMRAEEKGHQLVLPLLQNERVLGLLVAERGRPWDAMAQPQVDAVLQALTSACLLDQRSQWFEQKSLQQQVFQRQQKDLFDNLLHQFRNPLTAMRTFGKLLVKRLVESDRNHEAASSIVRESDRLQALLVQFEAAIEAGVRLDEMPKVLQAADFSDTFSEDFGSSQRPLMPTATLGRSVTLEAVNLQSVLQPVLQSASGIIDDRQQQLHLDYPDQKITILADPAALAEVLTNLIDNASKYSPQGGQIELTLSDRGDHIHLWITDTGYGIPQSDLEHLFERHYRGIQAQSDIPGTGLGLSIARELTRQMQGEIQVFSPPPIELALTTTSSTSIGTSIQVTLKKA
jgi:signal transduction histidine kinase